MNNYKFYDDIMKKCLDCIKITCDKYHEYSDSYISNTIEHYLRIFNEASVKNLIKKGDVFNMRDYEKLRTTYEKERKLQEEREKIKIQYYDNNITSEQFKEKISEIDNQIKINDITSNILKNNLYVLVHNELMKIYKEVYKKYESKNIGDKRKQEIEEIFKKQIENIFNYTDEPYYNRFYLYFQTTTEWRSDKRYFKISIDKLKYDFEFSIENEEVKSKYNITIPTYVENVEEEAERLYNIYNYTLKKKEEIEKQIDGLKSYLSSNFERNLYNEDISKLTRCLTLYW